MTRSVEDKDGEVRGFGFDATHPDVAMVASTVAAMLCDSQVVAALGYAKPAKTKDRPCCLEHNAIKGLQAVLKRHPLYPWVRAQRGVGAKQAARLLAAIGDPYIRPEWERDGVVTPEGPRTVSALVAYCGLHVLPASQPNHAAHRVHAGGVQHGDTGQPPSDARPGHAGVAAKRQRNQQSNWSETARMRLWNVAGKCKESGLNTSTCTGMAKSDTGFAIHSDTCGCGRYRLVYDAGRAKYADATHEAPCVRCGPKGHPAEPGTPLSPAHKDARALRLAMKEILKDLWRAGREWHLQNRGETWT